MTVMLDRSTERLSGRAKTVLGFLTAVVAAVAALVAYFVTSSTTYVKAAEFAPVKSKVEQHDALLPQIHEDIERTQDQLWDLVRQMGLRPLPRPKH